MEDHNALSVYHTVDYRIPCFTLGPLIFSLCISMFDWPVVGERTFVGLGNYIKMFTEDKQVLKSLVISIKYAAIFVPLNILYCFCSLRC